MLYALDKRTGKPVYAGSLNVPRWGLVCPNPKCGAPVYLRAGGYRAPHFAHVRWSASDDCDLYHPFDGVAPGITEIFPPPETSNKSKESEVLRDLALFVRTDAALNASLVLRVPAAEQEIKWVGQVRFATPTGELRLRQEHLTSDQQIDVAPTVNRYTGTLIGNVDEAYGKMITDGINGISAEKSLFRVDDGFGRRLGWNEGLFWGDDLVLVCGTETSYLEFLRFVATTSLEYQTLRLHTEYKCIELPLPNESETASHVKAAVAEYLEREISPRRPRVLLLEPPPHHFSAEGEWVVAGGAESIKLHRSKRESVTVKRDDGVTIPVQELSEDTVEFPVNSLGVYNAQLGTDSINIRVDQCPFNSASTIRVRRGAQTFSIEKLAASEQLCREVFSSPGDVTVEFDSPIFETILLINGQRWQGDDAFRAILRDKSVGIVLQVGSYLTLTLRGPTKDEPSASKKGEREILDADAVARQSYFLKYGVNSRVKVPVTTPEGSATASPLRVSIGVLPQLRWLNRKGRQL